MRPEKEHELKRNGRIIKWIYRIIGYKIAEILAETNIHPNAITFFRLIIAIIASCLISFQDYKTQLVGVVLLQIFSILDKTDGGLARIKGKESNLGGWLDSNFDVIGVVFANIGFWYCIKGQGHLFAILTMGTIFLFMLLKIDRLKMMRLKAVRTTNINVNNLDRNKSIGIVQRIYKFIVYQFAANGRTMVLLLSLGVVFSVENFMIILIFVQSFFTWLHLFLSISINISRDNY